MKNKNNSKYYDDWNDSQNNNTGNISLTIPSDDYLDPHDKHSAMTWEEFIYYRFMRVL